MGYIKQLLYESGGGIVPPLDDAKIRDDNILVIGIGGMGCETVSELKREVYQYIRPDKGNGSEDSYNNVRFLAVDSERFCVEKKEALPWKIDMQKEFFDLSHPYVQAILRNRDLLKSRKELDWLSDELRAPSGGTGGIRQIGRFLLVDQAEKFINRLHDTIINMRHASGRTIIYVVCGLNGGTGGGCFIDVCYLARKVLADLGISDAEIRGCFFLPDVSLTNRGIMCDPFLDSFLKCNGYAALKELDFLTREASKGCFKQDYGTFTYQSHQPPVDCCCLISSVDSYGKSLGYWYSIQLMTESIFLQLLAGGKDKNDLKEWGYGYGSVGLAERRFPHREILTYLSGRLFGEWKGMYLQRPTEEELCDFARNAKLEYDTILGELTEGVTFSISFPDFEAADIQKGNGTVIRACDDWIVKVLGKFKENSNALLIELEEHDSKSLIERLYKALDLKAKDTESGPCYAKRLLYSRVNKNFINILDGYLARAEEEQAAELRQEELRKGELESAELAFKNAGFFFRRQRFEKYIKALEAWYLHLAKIEQSEAMKTILREFRKQASALDTDYFNVLTTVLETVRDTFSRNLEILSWNQVKEENIGHARAVVEFSQIREKLDDRIRKMDAEKELKSFLEFFFAHSEEWRTKEDRKISKLLSDFMIQEFQDVSSQNIMQYMDKTTIERLKEEAEPILFWSSMRRQDQTTGQTIRLHDRISVCKWSSVSLKDYVYLPELWEAYDRTSCAGLHLYENGTENWRFSLPELYQAENKQ